MNLDEEVGKLVKKLLKKNKLLNELIDKEN